MIHAIRWLINPAKPLESKLTPWHIHDAKNPRATMCGEKIPQRSTLIRKTVSTDSICWKCYAAPASKKGKPGVITHEDVKDAVARFKKSGGKITTQKPGAAWVGPGNVHQGPDFLTGGRRYVPWA